MRADVGRSVRTHVLNLGRSTSPPGRWQRLLEDGLDLGCRWSIAPHEMQGHPCPSSITKTTGNVSQGYVVRLTDVNNSDCWSAFAFGESQGTYIRLPAPVRADVPFPRGEPQPLILQSRRKRRATFWLVEQVCRLRVLPPALAVRRASLAVCKVSVTFIASWQ